jgi:6-pyruvoyltetrahydropterin/6-carboxytetrahydropterin synthase
VSRLAVIELNKEELTFSAGHMLFSATHRETMHGHDYRIHVTFQTLIQSNGMAFDYRDYIKKIAVLCQTLDYRFILPEQSEYLRIEDVGNTWLVHVREETFSFLKRDVVVLPICNVTLEELSNWILQQLLKNPTELSSHTIQGMTVKITNGRGESGATSWTK